MIAIQILSVINIVITLLFLLCYAHQIIYIIVACFKKPVEYPETDKKYRYAVMISARDEENVIGQLCDSIRAQNYPAELVDIYVVADNCTDSTYQVAEDHGAHVFERKDPNHIGKGYALEFLFKKVREEKGEDYYEGFFIIDADNLLDENYIVEMNKAVAADKKIVVCYRNSKNYGDNWISAGSSLWFLRASRHLNNPRTILNTSCEVNGTGFFVHKDIINRQGGWIHKLMIEDIEFTVDNVIHGEKVVYCHRAMVYDEQPSTWKQSFRQRMRWSRGYLQILRKYGGKLIKGVFGNNGFSCYDMLMSISPAMFLTVIVFFISIIMLIISAVVGKSALIIALINVATTVVGAYSFFFIVGLVSGISEWNNMKTTTYKKVMSLFTFPLFMYTYLPIVAISLFKRVTWKPIEHHAVDKESELITKK